MDIDTTSINELPIMHSVPSDHPENDLIEKGNSGNHAVGQERIVMDPNVKQDTKQSNSSKQLPVKKVHFQNDTHTNVHTIPSKQESIKIIDGDSSYDLKIVILATVLFFLFLDPKIKKYLLNVLVQVFGTFLRTEYSNFTQIGILVYSLFYGCVLYALVRSIDIGSFKLSV